MIKTFFKHGSLYTVLTFLSKGLNFILLPIYVRVLSSADYGFLDIAVIICSLVNYIVTLEISQGIARFYGTLDDADQRIKMTSTAFWFTVFGYSLFIVSVLVLKNTVLSLIKINDFTDSLFLVVISYFVVNGLFMFLQNQLRWQLKPKLNVIVNILNVFITAISTVSFLLFFKMGITGMFLGMIIGNAVSGVVSFYIIKEIRFVFDFKSLKYLLCFSSPLVLSSIAFTVATGIDRFVIKSLMTIDDVGLYGIAYRLASPVSLIMAGFSTALTPLLYQNYKDEGTKGEISTIFKYFCILALGMFLGLSIFAPEILVIFTIEKYFGVYKVVPYLVISLLLSQQYVFFCGLGIAKKTGVIAIIRISEACLNTLFNFLFIPRFGIIGAAFATFLSILLATAVYVYQSQKYYRLTIDWYKLLIAFCICLLSIVLLQSKFIIYSLPVSIFVKIVLFLAVFLCIGFILAGKEFWSILNKLRMLHRA